MNTFRGIRASMFGVLAIGLVAACGAAPSVSTQSRGRPATEAPAPACRQYSHTVDPESPTLFGGLAGIFKVIDADGFATGSRTTIATDPSDPDLPVFIDSLGPSVPEAKALGGNRFEISPSQADQVRAAKVSGDTAYVAVSNPDTMSGQYYGSLAILFILYGRPDGSVVPAQPCNTGARVAVDEGIARVASSKGRSPKEVLELASDHSAGTKADQAAVWSALTLRATTTTATTTSRQWIDKPADSRSTFDSDIDLATKVKLKRVTLRLEIPVAWVTKDQTNLGVCTRIPNFAWNTCLALWEPNLGPPNSDGTHDLTAFVKDGQPLEVDFTNMSVPSESSLISTLGTVAPARLTLPSSKSVVLKLADPWKGSGIEQVRNAKGDVLIEE